MSHPPPLLPEDTINLINLRDPSLIRPEQDGFRQMSMELLSSPSNISSRTPSSSTSSSGAAAPVYIRVPVQLYSAQTFEFIGFTAERAATLEASRLAKQQKYNMEVDILKHALEYIEHNCASVEDSSDDWDAAMIGVGIKSEIRGSIMKEEHRAIRGIQNLSAWLEDIMKTYYYALNGLNEKILAALDSPP